jgi:hypothetical protein
MTKTFLATVNVQFKVLVDEENAELAKGISAANFNVEDMEAIVLDEVSQYTLASFDVLVNAEEVELKYEPVAKEKSPEV